MASQARDLLSNLGNLKVADLKKELKDRGIVLSGTPKKADLMTKLTDVLMEQLRAETTTTGAFNAASLGIQDPDDLLAQTLQELSEEPIGGTVPKAASTQPATTEPLKPASPTKSPIKISTAAQPVATSSAETAGSTSPAKTTTSPTKNQNDVLSARAARFGIPTNPASTEALKKRSERFGVVSDSLKKIEDQGKLAERQKRFGDTGDSNKASAVKTAVPVSDEKLAARQARFGVVTPDPATTKQGKKTLTQRSQLQVKRKVLSAEEEEKLAKRKARFAAA